MALVRVRAPHAARRLETMYAVSTRSDPACRDGRCLWSCSPQPDPVPDSHSMTHLLLTGCDAAAGWLCRYRIAQSAMFTDFDCVYMSIAVAPSSRPQPDCL